MFSSDDKKQGGGNPIPINGVSTVRAHCANPEQQLALEHVPTLPSTFHKGFVHCVNTA